MRARRRHLVFALAFALTGCHSPKPPPLVKRAAFGVLFGGQIQDRKDVPFELDPTAQTLGFRIEFNQPLQNGVDVAWNVGKPKPKPRPKFGKQRKTEPPETLPIVGKEKAGEGESRFERVVRLAPGDPLGRWSIRVTVGEETVIDRNFDVYDPKDRNPDAPDGG